MYESGYMCQYICVQVNLLSLLLLVGLLVLLLLRNENLLADLLEEADERKLANEGRVGGAIRLPVKAPMIAPRRPAMTNQMIVTTA